MNWIEKSAKGLEVREWTRSGGIRSLAHRTGFSTDRLKVAGGYLYGMDTDPHCNMDFSFVRMPLAGGEIELLPNVHADEFFVDGDFVY